MLKKCHFIQHIIISLPKNISYFILLSIIYHICSGIYFGQHITLSFFINDGLPPWGTRLIDSIKPKILSKSNHPMNGEWVRGFSRSFLQMAITMARDQEKLISEEVAKMFLNAYLSCIHLIVSLCSDGKPNWDLFLEK